ncbi:MAG: FtsW/RodA/SpoVE family cell cycle protein [Bacteroidetes bacterium]|nr:FtsW/RodA/SpoVE family cell cycle protein [Bacteroidota bacterium]
MSNLFQHYFKGDRFLWLAIIILSVVGLMAVYSSTGTLAFAKQGGRTEYYLFKQGSFMFLGFLLMYLIHRIDYRYFSRISQWLIWIAMVLLVVTIFAGNDINEAKRTLTIPLVGISFQTSDLARLALVMYIARYLSKNQDKLDEWKPFWWLVAVIGVTCFLIMPENLSTSLVLFTTSLVLLFIGNVRMKHLLVLVSSFVALLSIGAIFLLNAPDNMLPGRAKTWKVRFENFVGGDDQDAYQTIQAKIAIANGGIIGKGPGKSIQKNTLPQAYSDFIYAIIIEEYGLIGGILLIVVFLFILFRSIRMVVRSPRAFGALLAVGLCFTLVFQSLINMAVAVALFPVTGLTLPLISMGGTSIIFTGVAFGIILSVSRTTEDDEDEVENSNAKFNTPIQPNADNA